MRNEADRSVGVYVAVNSGNEAVALCVDNPERRKDTAKFVAECIRDGLTMTRCTVGDVWDGRVTLNEKMPSEVNPKDSIQEKP